MLELYACTYIKRCLYTALSSDWYIALIVIQAMNI